LAEIDSHFPLLVGRGRGDSGPAVWLCVPAQTGWIPLVAENQSVHPAISVEKGPGTVKVLLLKKHQLLEVVQRSGTAAEIVQLDLRFAGLNMVGDTQSLRVGNLLFSHSSFTNTDTMLRIGGGEASPAARAAK